MLGLLLLGLFSKTKNVKGALIGVLVGILVIVWMSLSGTLFGEDSLGASFHTYLTIVFGTAAIFLVGFLISIFNKKTDEIYEN